MNGWYRKGRLQFMCILIINLYFPLDMGGNISARYRRKAIVKEHVNGLEGFFLSIKYLRAKWVGG